MLPHPNHVIVHIERRSAEIQAESARDRQATLAISGRDSNTAATSTGRLAAITLIVALALLALAGLPAPAIVHVATR